MANKALGAKLRELRISNGYTQQQIADMLNLKNKSTLGNWEIGNSEPDAMTFLKLCRIYKVDDIMLEFTGKSLSTDSNPMINMFDRLDAEDKAEIRGEMKQMLKADKYKTNTIADDMANTIKSINRVFGKATNTRSV